MRTNVVAVTGVLLAAGLVWLLSLPATQAQQPGGNPLTGFPNMQPLGGPSLTPDQARFVQGLTFSKDPVIRNRFKAGDTGPEPNQDIVVKPDIGAWMVCVMTYEGEQRHQMARQFVAELRSQYRQPAYVFNHGRAERIQEDQRILKYVADKRRELKNLGITDPEYKIPIRRVPIKETTAVLIGGYRDMVTAKLALDSIKKLTCPDSKRVQLDQGCIAEIDKKGNVTGKQQWVFVNPFPRSFVVPNPSMPRQAQQGNSLDAAALRPLNASEPFSLLNCPKKITLAIKEFRVRTIIQTSLTTQKTSPQVGARNEGGRDDAAFLAHRLAEYFRKMNVEAYVLHTPMSSIVCIGSFDSATDRPLQNMQARYNQALQSEPDLQQLRLFPNAWPMQVPH